MEGQLIWRGSGRGCQCWSRRVQRINMMLKFNVLVFLSIAILCSLLPRVPNTRKDCFYQKISFTWPKCYFMLVELVSLTLGNETGKVGNQIRVGTPSGPSSTVRRTIEKIIIHPAFTTTRKDSNIGLFYFLTLILIWPYFITFLTHVDPNLTLFWPQLT